jgi:ElaB/YqjD/DUF883 family membrane-anchored ribosome-binding protein
MDKTECYIKQNIEETRAAMNEKIKKIEGRVHETMDGTKSTIASVVSNIHRVKDTVEETKSVIDTGIDTLRQAIDETVERVKSTAELIDQVKQNPWIMLGSAALVGYVLGSLNRQEALGVGYADEQDHIREQARPSCEPQHSAASHASA